MCPGYLPVPSPLPQSPETKVIPLLMYFKIKALLLLAFPPHTMSVMQMSQWASQGHLSFQVGFQLRNSSEMRQSPKGSLA